MKPKAENQNPMSSDYQLVITDIAQEDFRDILSYTLSRWGERQLEIYENLLHDALLKLENDWEKGIRDYPPYFCLRAGKHCIFYRIAENKIFVVRILHSRMEFTRHLADVDLPEPYISG